MGQLFVVKSPMQYVAAAFFERLHSAIDSVAVGKTLVTGALTGCYMS